MLYNLSIMKRIKLFSNLSASFILTLILSSAFCSQILPGVAAASDTGHMSHNQMSVSVVASCGGDMVMAVVTPVFNGQGFSTTVPPLDSNDCCFNQDHHPNLITGQDLSASAVLAVLAPAVDQSISLPLVSFTPQINILPPPQMEALLSVLKRE